VKIALDKNCWFFVNVAEGIFYICRAWSLVVARKIHVVASIRHIGAALVIEEDIPSYTWVFERLKDDEIYKWQFVFICAIRGVNNENIAIKLTCFLLLGGHPKYLPIPLCETEME
jgi:hypothetical protein